MRKESRNALEALNFFKGSDFMKPSSKTSRATAFILVFALITLLLPGMAFTAEYTEWTSPDSLPTKGVYKLMTNVTLSDCYFDFLIKLSSIPCHIGKLLYKVHAD